MTEKRRVEKVKKQPKKPEPEPEPKPCERWAVYNERGRFVHSYESKWRAEDHAWGERTMHRVRIVPVAKGQAKRRKGGK